MMPRTVSRRSLMASVPIVLGATSLRAQATLGAGAERDPEWPAWAPHRADLYAQLDAARHGGTDLRHFGATLNGIDDDTAAFERAVKAGVKTLVIPAALDPKRPIRLTRQIVITAPITIVGSGDASVIRWEGAEDEAFLVTPPDKDPTHFVKGVHIDGIRMIGATGKPRGHILLASNVRGLSLSRCSTQYMGGVFVNHQRALLGMYRRDIGSETTDPAVAAGFSGTDVNDLNEEVCIFDNRIDGGSYFVHVIRFNFTRRVAVVGNIGHFANVSWWGGGAKVTQGGAIGFLRRVREVFVSRNKLGGSNGGVYGNNGDGIIISYNEVSMTTDVGVDFEGCFNGVAHHNIVRNAGNFCYVVFYAAKNIVFRNNIGIQDGGATGISHLYKVNAYGAERGTSLFAMRCAGFGLTPGAVVVDVTDNQFAWQGKTGLGNVTPSYCTHLALERNQFTNVVCDFTYRRMQELVLADNRLSFDRSAPVPVRLLAGAAASLKIDGNQIRITAPQPEGSSGVTVGLLKGGRLVDISDNHVVGPPQALASAAIVLRDLGNGTGAVTIAGNTAAALFSDTPNVQASRNARPDGGVLGVQPVPPQLAAAWAASQVRAPVATPDAAPTTE